MRMPRELKFIQWRYVFVVCIVVIFARGTLVSQSVSDMAVEVEIALTH